jgi:predicted regulator of amino acid metabolism with ACT domain
VYNETSEVTFTIVAIDTGVPRRGATATVRLVLSNTCLLNVLFEEIVSNLEIDGATGQVWFRILKYWVYDYGMLDFIYIRERVNSYTNIAKLI